MMWSVKRLLAAVCCVAVLGASCGSGDAATVATTTEAPTTTAATSTTTTIPAGPLAPLTGLEVADPAVLDRPALIVKIDNIAGAARPQNGLGYADIVYEEKIEGVSTRFAAIFHSYDAPSIGPIRSGRSTDVAIIHAFNRPAFAMSGANAVMVLQILGAPLINMTRDAVPDLYPRRDDRRAPDNIFSNTADFWSNLPEEGEPPLPMFAYRDADAEALAGSGPAVRVSVNWGTGVGGTPVVWDFDDAAGNYLRTQSDEEHVDELGDQIAAENVLVQFVDYVGTGLVDPAGSPVPEAVLTGEGTGILAMGGERHDVSWSRPTVEDPTTWTHLDGSPMELNPGRTWIELAEANHPDRAVFE